MRELFIYYRAQLADAVRLQTEVTAWHHDLQRRHPGLHTRLMRRPLDADGWITWMETYALPHDPDGVTPALQQAIEQEAAAGLATLIPGPRHSEVFLACA